MQKRLELLDDAKIVYFTKRADLIRQEVSEILNIKSQDADVIKQKESELGHKKEKIEEMYKQTKGVKNISETLPVIVNRLEQKKKIHDMAAHILLTISNLEKQQTNIHNLCHRDNKEVL